jgi:hypothetical protein
MLINCLLDVSQFEMMHVYVMNLTPSLLNIQFIVLHTAQDLLSMDELPSKIYTKVFFKTELMEQMYQCKSCLSNDILASNEDKLESTEFLSFSLYSENITELLSYHVNEC